VRGTRSWLLGTAILALLASACGAVVEGQATPPPVAATPSPAPPSAPVSTLVSPSPESSSNPEAQTAVDAAKRDAAERLGIAANSGDLHVQQIEAREWPDSSLGCPRQGLMYSQIVTPGYLVVIGAPGKQLEYHADARGRIVFCKET
jgi:hypothetical protein